MIHNPRWLPIGSVSSGTLQDSDLLMAFISAARTIRLSVEERKRVNAIAAEYEAFDDEHDWAPEEVERHQDMITELEGILNQHVPDFCYFGAHPGDGADIGCWIDDEAIRQNRDIIANSRDFAGPCHIYALEVNDHGNATLYRRVRNRWIEVWSVV